MVNLTRHDRAAIGVALLCGVVIIYATRHDPVLSPDSISYLSAAAHLRGGHGLTEFTGKPLTVFGPVLPILLSVGGRSLMWARVVGATAVAGSTWLMFVLLRRRIRPIAAVVAAATFGLSQGLVRVGSTVWSETPFILITLAALAVLAVEPLTDRRAAVGGALCGLGFLTRYAGVGLIVTGLCMVAIAAPRLKLDRRRTVRVLAIHLGAASAVCAVWIVRNLIETGQGLGPRFSGGSSDSLEVLLRRSTTSIGELILGNQTSPSFVRSAGLVLVLLLAGAAIIIVARSPSRVLDIGMAVFALTSVVIPIAARRMTASDIDFRVLSPVLIAIVYFGAIMIDRIRVKPIALIVSACLIGWWAFEGIAMAQRTPEVVAIGAGSRTQFSRELFDLIDTLPEDAHVLTNSPQRVWWQSHREPTLFAFTRPRAGNSNYPLSPQETLHYACLPHTYLAWFAGTTSVGDAPQDRRPDLAAIIDLTVVNTVPGGVMYLLSAHDPGQCPH